MNGQVLGIEITFRIQGQISFSETTIDPELHLEFGRQRLYLLFVVVRVSKTDPDPVRPPHKTEKVRKFLF